MKPITQDWLARRASLDEGAEVTAGGASIPTPDRFETHSIRYDYDGSQWVLDVKATSASDALARVRAATQGQYIGTEIVPLWPPSRLQRLLLRVHQFFGHLRPGGTP